MKFFRNKNKVSKSTNDVDSVPHPSQKSCCSVVSPPSEKENKDGIDMIKNETCRKLDDVQVSNKQDHVEIESEACNTVIAVDSKTKKPESSHGSTSNHTSCGEKLTTSSNDKVSNNQDHVRNKDMGPTTNTQYLNLAQSEKSVVDNFFSVVESIFLFEKFDNLIMNPTTNTPESSNGSSTNHSSCTEEPTVVCENDTKLNKSVTTVDNNVDSVQKPIEKESCLGLDDIKVSSKQDPKLNKSVTTVDNNVDSVQKPIVKESCLGLDDIQVSSKQDHEINAKDTGLQTIDSPTKWHSDNISYDDPQKDSDNIRYDDPLDRTDSTTGYSTVYDDSDTDSEYSASSDDGSVSSFQFLQEYILRSITSFTSNPSNLDETNNNKSSHLMEDVSKSTPPIVIEIPESSEKENKDGSDMIKNDTCRKLDDVQVSNKQDHVEIESEAYNTVIAVDSKTKKPESSHGSTSNHTSCGEKLTTSSNDKVSNNQDHVRNKDMGPTTNTQYLNLAQSEKSVADNFFSVVESIFLFEKFDNLVMC